MPYDSGIGVYSQASQALAPGVAVRGTSPSAEPIAPMRGMPAPGPGYLGGTFPSGIATVDGTPVIATIRIHLRPEEGAQGDGILVAQTTSAADGTWRVDNLDPNLKFDIIGRRAGFNDVIVANVSPTPYHQIVIEGDLALETDDG